MKVTTINAGLKDTIISVNRVHNMVVNPTFYKVAEKICLNDKRGEDFVSILKDYPEGYFDACEENKPTYNHYREMTNDEKAEQVGRIMGNFKYICDKLKKQVKVDPKYMEQFLAYVNIYGFKYMIEIVK